jgi:hypothetical protein
MPFLRLSVCGGGVMSNATQHLKAGWSVYSKRCGRVGGFDGLIVERRGSGYQVLDPKTGKTFQRDHYDLIAQQTEVSDHQS